MSVELAHDAFGENGPPIVVLHGLLGSARNWTTIAKQLADTHRVFTLDLRNHARSPWADSMSFGEMAGDVAAFIERHALSRPAVIGHSLGGKVAMRLALTRSGLVERLVVVDVAPVAYAHTFGPLVEAMQAGSVAESETEPPITATEIPNISTSDDANDEIVFSFDEIPSTPPAAAVASSDPRSKPAAGKPTEANVEMKVELRQSTGTEPKPVAAKPDSTRSP